MILVQQMEDGSICPDMDAALDPETHLPIHWWTAGDPAEFDPEGPARPTDQGDRHSRSAHASMTLSAGSKPPQTRDADVPKSEGEGDAETTSWSSVAGRDDGVLRRVERVAHVAHLSLARTPLRQPSPCRTCTWPPSLRRCVESAGGPVQGYSMGPWGAGLGNSERRGLPV